MNFNSFKLIIFCYKLNTESLVPFLNQNSYTEISPLKKVNMSTGANLLREAAKRKQLLLVGI
jgi:hypothetical protein